MGMNLCAFSAAQKVCSKLENQAKCGSLCYKCTEIYFSHTFWLLEVAIIASTNYDCNIGHRVQPVYGSVLFLSTFENVVNVLIWILCLLRCLKLFKGAWSKLKYNFVGAILTGIQLQFCRGHWPIGQNDTALIRNFSRLTVFENEFLIK